LLKTYGFFNNYKVDAEYFLTISFDEQQALALEAFETQ